MNTSLDNRTVFITGASGGLGAAFVDQALERGAAKVYAGARRQTTRADKRVVPVPLDITNVDDVAEAASVAPDVDFLVNSAGIAPAGDYITGDESEVRQVFETNFFGTLRVANAFAPILGANGGGTMLNILSTAAWVSVPTAYGASKAATWSATNALRLLLEGQGTQVVSLLVGMIDTPMSARWDVPKVSPAHVAAQAFDDVAQGALEVLADDTARQLKDALSTPGEQFYPWLHEQLATFTP